MNKHEDQPEPGKSAMKSSANTRIIIAASGFMLLMLVMTAPQDPARFGFRIMDPDLYRTLYPFRARASSWPAKRGSGPVPDPAIAWARTITNP